MLVVEELLEMLVVKLQEMALRLILFQTQHLLVKVLIVFNTLVEVAEALTLQEIQVEMVETEAEAEVETDKTLLLRERLEQLILVAAEVEEDYLLVLESTVVVESL